MYQQPGADQGPNPGENNPDSGSVGGDDVVDGEFHSV